MSGSQSGFLAVSPGRNIVLSRPHVVAVTGTLDLASIGDVRATLSALIDAGNMHLIVDLSRVRLCDAVAMSGLVRVSRSCTERGGWLRLASPVGIVATAFRIVSLGSDVEVYPSVAAAHGGADGDRIMR